MANFLFGVVTQSSVRNFLTDDCDAHAKPNEC